MDSALKHKFILLRAQGVSFDKCADELGKAKQTLVNWARELKEEIANARALELEALQEEFALTKRKRLEAIGRALGKIRDELAQRDLKDISTEKLLELHAKYIQLAEAEYVEPKFKSETEVEEERDEAEYLDSLITGRRSPRKLKSARN